MAKGTEAQRGTAAGPQSLTRPTSQTMKSGSQPAHFPTFGNCFPKRGSRNPSPQRRPRDQLTVATRNFAGPLSETHRAPFDAVKAKKPHSKVKLFPRVIQPLRPQVRACHGTTPWEMWSQDGPVNKSDRQDLGWGRQKTEVRKET